MENEGEEIVVTAPRLRDSGGSSGGGDWAVVSFSTTSFNPGADSFDFGGGGDIVVTAPPEEPAEEETPPEDEIVVTAPEPPTQAAFEAGVILTNWANHNVVGDFRVTLDGDTAKLEFFDVLTGEHVEYFHSSNSHFWIEEKFDVDSYERDPAFFQNPSYETQHVDWF